MIDAEDPLPVRGGTASSNATTSSQRYSCPVSGSTAMRTVGPSHPRKPRTRSSRARHASWRTDSRPPNSIVRTRKARIGR